ncbi:unnamed protein product [Callosobruchus maculatus]|uniref:Uncharacterized protein n=1 Tax=Callosobruchus maculatus TaxID=64391 RepID=A0A653BVZ1_CALMS|nr:unnamed protein product [Callosobruchus maculatus]
MVLFHVRKIQLNKFSTFGVFAETFLKKVLDFLLYCLALIE